MRPQWEAQVLDWEDNVHVPWVMKYKGIAKIVRYEKAAGGIGDAALPKFQNFKDAEADRVATWTDAQLTVNPIVATSLAL